MQGYNRRGLIAKGKCQNLCFVPDECVSRSDLVCIKSASQVAVLATVQGAC